MQISIYMAAEGGNLILPPAFMRGVARRAGGECEGFAIVIQLPQSASLTAPSSKWGPRVRCNLEQCDKLGFKIPGCRFGRRKYLPG